MRSCVITYLLAAVVAIAVLTVLFAADAAAVALAGLAVRGCCPRCACACAKEQKKPGNFNRMLASLRDLAAILFSNAAEQQHEIRDRRLCHDRRRGGRTPRGFRRWQQCLE